LGTVDLTHPVQTIFSSLALSSNYVRTMLKRFIVLLCLLACAGACARQQPLIRVAIKTDADAVRLRLEGAYSMTDIRTGKVLHKGRGNNTAALSVCEQRLCIDTRPLDTDAIRVQASKGLGVQAGPGLTWYRGDLDVLADATGRLSAINRLELEDYLCGVLPREVPASWPMAALQAQAVASRTYALHRIEQAGELPTDVSADVLSQVYGGRSAESWRTSRAVKRTRGTALVYHEQLVPAFFHASCGGHTENALFVWNLDSEVLRGTACPYCIDRPSYDWKRNFNTRTVQAQLNSRGYPIGPIKAIEVSQYSPSGRAYALNIHGLNKKSLTIPAAEFRMALGPDIVRSTLFEVVMQGNNFDLTGHGWGHGVGMCQQGACGMALAGKSMLDILEFYYSGITLKKMY
jgi:stage II sporulation protein D